MMLKSKKSKDDAAKVLSAGPSLADLVSSATASADLDSVLADLDAGIEAAKRDFAAAIERQRDLSIDPGTASDAVIRYERLVATLTLRRQEVARKRDVLVTAERRAATEAQIAAVHAEHVPALETSWQRLHSLLGDVAAVSKDIETHETAIENSNAIARQQDRVDLVRRVRNVRDGVAAVHARPMPDRLRAIPVRNKGETDDAFALRVGNVQALRADAARRGEPFVTSGTAAIEAIMKIAVDDPDVRTALRQKLRQRHSKVTPLIAGPGEASNDPVERAALEREYRRQNARHDPGNLASKGAAEPLGDASGYQRYQYGGL
jgi:hypothetical protein